MSARPYILAETNWADVKATDFEVAILPWGATEAHNYHLPYATDNYQVDYVAAGAAEFAWNQGTKCIVLPCIPFGINTGQLDVPLCININSTTQLTIAKDIVDVLLRANIQKLMILNGHGGNDFRFMIRELSFYFPDMLAVYANWYQAVDWNSYFDHPGDHAGEMETSAIQHIRPDLVQSLEMAGDGFSKVISHKGDERRLGKISTTMDSNHSGYRCWQS